MEITAWWGYVLVILAGISFIALIWLVAWIIWFLTHMFRW